MPVIDSELWDCSALRTERHCAPLPLGVVAEVDSHFAVEANVNANAIDVDAAHGGVGVDGHWHDWRRAAVE